MRKLCFLLTALLLTGPAFAGVTISCAQITDTNQVEVSYVASDDANLPRAFGLDIQLDNGMLIGDIVSGSESEDYWVYPGTIVITDGSVSDAGTPMAPSDDPGACGGSGESCMTVEMGSLYNDPCDPVHQDPPALSGVLFRFIVYGEANCIATISGNSARGNVVLEDTEPAGDVTYGTCAIFLDCYTGPDAAEWVTVGRPDSWCNPRQCHGDADGLLHTVKGLADHWVGAPDLTALAAGWRQEYSGSPDTDGPDPDALPDTWIAADFAHDLNTVKGYPDHRVGSPDLTIMANYWRAPNPPNTTEPPADCLTDTPVSP
jgi:hypothetical protein